MNHRKQTPAAAPQQGNRVWETVKAHGRLYFVDAMSAMAQGLFASLLIGTINNGLMFFGLSTAQQTVAKGAIIILSVALSALVSLRDNNNK